MSGLRWKRFLEKTEARLLALPDGFLQAVGQLEMPSMASILACAGAEDLSVSDLRSVARLRRDFAQLQSALQALPAEVPDAIVAEAWSLDRVDALHRVARLLSMATAPAPPEAWRAGLQIWLGAAGVARKEATWGCHVLSTSHPRYTHYGDLLQRKETLEELPGHRWLAGCQAEEEGVLEMQWQLPALSSMLPQVALYRSDLGEVASARSDASLLQELATDALPGWLRRWAHEAATKHAIEAATTSYRELLLKPPLQVPSLAAVYIGGLHSHAAIVWLDADCQLQDEHWIELITHNDKPDIHRMAHAIQRALKQRKTEAVALPLRAANRDLLQLVVKVLNHDFGLHRVREAGLSAAREAWTQAPHRHRKEVAAAIALGQRLLQPQQAWSTPDPLALGLAEYQEHIEAQALRDALLDERTLAQAQLTKATTSLQSHLPNQSRLNPMIKSLRDLRPGLMMQGIVANVTDFGAFVNIGLPEEGLVHKSEIADRFVSHPSEVVRVGQQVNVRVLSVDTKQERISLSMRSSMAPKPRSSSQRKAQALRDLDSLFKK